MERKVRSREVGLMSSRLRADPCRPTSGTGEGRNGSWKSPVVHETGNINRQCLDKVLEIEIYVAHAATTKPKIPIMDHVLTTTPPF